MARTFGGASTDVALTNLTSHSNTGRSWAIWAYRTGDGGGSAGRMFDKTSAGTQVEQFLTIGVDYGFFRGWSLSTAGRARWDITRPAANEWHHMVVTYDGSSTANDPLIYLDGVSQTVVEIDAPVGTITDNADAFRIGNNGSATRNWAGRLAEFVVYDRILTPTEVRGLCLYGPHRLGIAWVDYVPLLGTEIEPEWQGSSLSRVALTGTVRAEHAPDLTPSLRRPAWRLARR